MGKIHGIDKLSPRVHKKTVFSRYFTNSSKDTVYLKYWLENLLKINYESTGDLT